MEFGHLFSFRGLRRAGGLSLRALALGAILTAAHCGQPIPGPGTLITIAYDQSLNFQRYRFEESVITQPDNDDFTTIVGLPNDGGQGVWLVYIICEIDNPASDPKLDVDVNLSDFFVTYEGQTYKYNPTMAAYTYENSQGLPATPFDIDEVGTQFREETQLGTDSITVTDGTTYTAPTRIAIYVNFSGVGMVVDAVDLELPLRWGPTPPNPHFMKPRNQTPAMRDINLVTMKRHLPIVCRPPRPVGG